MNARVSLVVLAASVLLPTHETRGQDDAATRASLLAQIETAVEAGRFEDVERDLARFRKLFPPSSGVKGWDNGNEVVYLYDPTAALATHHESAGRLDDALRVYIEAVEVLAPGVPHYEYRFVPAMVPLLLVLEKRSPEECKALLQEYRARFAQAAEQVESEGRKGLFRGLISRTDSALKHLALVGREAPAFRFTRAYNAEVSMSLADLKGKVVLIDFWATWCKPCIKAWKPLRELREKHADRGFEILGITSLVESFGKKYDMTEQDEIDMTEELIEKHSIAWPVLFTDRPVNDPEYGVTSLPTYAVIDREGKVAAVLAGEFRGLGVQLVERLLAEPVPEQR